MSAASKRTAPAASASRPNLTADERLALVFEGAAEIEGLANALFEGLANPKAAVARPEVSMLVVERVRHVARALLAVGQPEIDDEHVAEHLAGEFRWGHRVIAMRRQA